MSAAATLTEVIPNADAEMCGLPGPMARTVCGLVAGHECEHWTCSDELVAQFGPFALRRVTVIRAAADTPADETHPTTKGERSDVTALSTVPADRCPECGDQTVESAAHEDALVRHGGYGETRSTVRRACATCGWTLTASVGATRPPKQDTPADQQPR